MDLGLCTVSSAAWALGTGAGWGAKPLGPLPTAETGWPRGEPPEIPNGWHRAQWHPGRPAGVGQLTGVLLLVFLGASPWGVFKKAGFDLKRAGIEPWVRVFEKMRVL